MVNTFLPYSDYSQCAKVLDDKRLGKQRVEAKQIIDIIEKISLMALNNKIDKPYIAWSHHPAVLMWMNNVESLKEYYNCIVKEWVARGFVNNMNLYQIKGKPKKPWFIGVKLFHQSYQANLVRKDPYYKDKFPISKSPLLKYTYIWPSKLTSEQKKLLLASKKTNKSLSISDFTTLVK